MALQKLHTLDNGIPLSIYRVMSYRNDPLMRELSAVISAYCTGASSNKPAVPIFAKLRVEGPSYDKYFSKTVLSEAAKEGKDIYAIMYEVAKTESVICDAGPTFFHDAEDA